MLVECKSESAVDWGIVIQSHEQAILEESAAPKETGAQSTVQ
jgi:hypothetical protein